MADNVPDLSNINVAEITAKLAEIMFKKEGLEKQAARAQTRAKAHTQTELNTYDSYAFRRRRLTVAAHYDGHHINDGVAIPPATVETELFAYCIAHRTTHPVKECVYVKMVYNGHPGLHYVCRKWAREHNLEEYIIK